MRVHAPEGGYPPDMQGHAYHSPFLRLMLFEEIQKKEG